MILLNCSWDYVELFDGPSTGSPSLGKYCGTSYVGTSVGASGSTMTLKFVSDIVVPRTGFLAKISGEHYIILDWYAYFKHYMGATNLSNVI